MLLLLNQELKTINANKKYYFLCDDLFRHIKIINYNLVFLNILDIIEITNFQDISLWWIPWCVYFNPSCC